SFVIFSKGMSASAHIATKSSTNSFLESEDLNAAVRHVCRDVVALVALLYCSPVLHCIVTSSKEDRSPGPISLINPFHLLKTGDKAFGEFLLDEIKEEKKIQMNKSLPKMSGGWEQEMNGTEVKLTRQVSGEKVTVTFNVNNSIPPNFEEEVEQGQQQKPAEDEPEIVSSPNFVIEVTKQGAKYSLVFDCHFPEDEMSHGDGEEENDIFAIREVSFQPEGDSDWKETSYTLNTDSLDWALYDHMMDFLADRGVDNTFADELVELSTAIEHQEYIKFLEDLQSFVNCK
uniref:Complement component 1 Q subcomponent-binding protein, mitochondrial n=1 Tax=Fundulus heteroclitus TaxID=8078 RepID=A0A3Q2Q9I3_FUNHE